MAETTGRCEACGEPFKWDDTLIKVNEEHYHDDCVDLYPSGYVAFLKGDISDGFLGETENHDGESAYEIYEELLDDVDTED